MDILVLSKTHMNGGRCCVGGMTDTGVYVRLLTATGDNQPNTTELSPRQIWNIEFTERQDINPPHVEDILIQSKELKGVLNAETKVLDYIKQRNVPVWEGSLDTLFDNTLKWTDNGSGYVDKEAIPVNSVGFWISDKDLSKSIYFDKVRYSYRLEDGWRSLPYKGFDKPINYIPAGTLIRVSLARWWTTNGTTELRCPLQLSGWYDLN